MRISGLGAVGQAARLAALPALAIGVFVIGSPTLPAADPGAGPSLWPELRSAERALLRARIEGDPNAQLAAEREYERLLAEARTILPRWTVAPDSSGDSCAPILARLLVAQDPSASDWLLRNRALAPRMDPSGQLTFWAGCAAYQAGQWSVAREAFETDPPVALRPVRDWLLTHTLARIEPAASIALARKTAAEHARHPFRERLVLHAARGIIESGDPDAAISFLTPCLSWPLSAPARGAAETLLAEAARRQGRGADCRKHFEAATRASSDFLGHQDLRLAQARWILANCRPLPSGELADCMLAVARFDGALDALEVWEAHASGLAAGDDFVVAKDLLERLHRAREADATLKLARLLEKRSHLRLQRLGALMRARVWRRKGDLAAMRPAYRRAAGDERSPASGWESEIAAPALWELARELEDAHLWAESAAAYAELVRRFPNDAQAPEASVREAFCWYGGGREAEALALLHTLCANARADRLGAPCLWAALWSGAGPADSLLRLAAGERNPGYNALRAAHGRMWMIAGGSSDPCRTDGFWRELGAEIRTPSTWDWPSSPVLDGDRSARLIARIEENPLSLVGRFFLSTGRPEWARILWRSSPDWTALSVEERTVMLRAFGDIGESVRCAIADGARRDRYPVVHPLEVSAAAQRFGISPAFLLALMRQESLFEPAALSPAGARGLLQLMPETAARTARALAVTKYDLDNPRDNILLGAGHLAQLFEDADGRVPLVLAAYNAGWAAARSWMRPNQTWDEYVERIPYTETRRFVKSVLMHYWFYRHCYPDEGRSGAEAQADCMCR